MPTIAYTLGIAKQAQRALEEIRRIQADMAAKAEPVRTEPPKRKRGKAKRKERG